MKGQSLAVGSIDRDIVIAIELQTNGAGLGDVCRGMLELVRSDSEL